VFSTRTGVPYKTYILVLYYGNFPSCVCQVKVMICTTLAGITDYLEIVGGSSVE
jgi:hypothetical protein